MASHAATSTMHDKVGFDCEDLRLSSGHSNGQAKISTPRKFAFCCSMIVGFATSVMIGFFVLGPLIRSFRADTDVSPNVLSKSFHSTAAVNHVHRRPAMIQAPVASAPITDTNMLITDTLAGRQRASEPKMMAKKVARLIKLAIPAGKANPAPPIGPALGSAGANIMMFCKEYNARTADQVGTIIPVVISVYEDKSFTFILKTPPASELLKKAAKIQKGSGKPAGRDYVKAGEVTMAQIEEIAKIKMPDLNTNNLDAAMRTIMGTARSMGVEVIDKE